jgi:hypothetical protein
MDTALTDASLDPILDDESKTDPRFDRDAEEPKKETANG